MKGYMCMFLMVAGSIFILWQAQLKLRSRYAGVNTTACLESALT